MAVARTRIFISSAVRLGAYFDIQVTVKADSHRSRWHEALAVSITKLFVS